MTLASIVSSVVSPGDVGSLQGRDSVRDDTPSAARWAAGDNLPFWLLCIAVVGVPLVWTRSVFRPFVVPKEALFFLLMAGAISLWALDRESGVHLRLPKASGDRAGLAFLALGAFSLLWAYSPALGLVTLIRFLALGAFYYLLAAALNTERRVQILLSLFIGVVGVAAAYGLVQFYDLYNYPGDRRPFLLSTLGHPNFASNFVGMGLPIIILFFLTSSGWKRWLAFLGACLGFAFLLAAQTRSVWVAVLVACVVGSIVAWVQPACRSLIRNTRKGLLALLGAFLLITIVFSTESPLNRRIVIWSRAAGLAVPESAEHLTVGSRWLIWKATLLMAREHPLAGVGIGNFGAHSAEYMTRARATSPWADPRYRTEFFLEAHNDYLQLLAEMGPAGLLALLWFLGWHLALARQRLKDVETTGHEALRLIGLVVAVLVFLVDAMFSLPFSVLNSSVAAVALLACMRRTAARGGWEGTFAAGESRPGGEALSPFWIGVCVPRRAVVAVALAASMVTSGCVAAFVAADYFMSRGEKAVAAGDFAAGVPWYGRAIRANPFEWRYRVGLGAAYNLASRYEMALEAAGKAEGFLKRASTAEMMGVAYRELGQVERAQAEYRRALWYEPHSAVPRMNLVGLFLDQKKFAEAAEEAQQGIRWNPDNGMLHIYLAEAQAGLGQRSAALETAQVGAAIMPSSRYAFNLLRELASAAGRPDIAEAAARRLRAITHYETFQQQRKGRLAGPQPMMFLLNAIAIDPQYADPHFELGEIKRGQGGVEEAIAEFSAYLKKAPRGERTRRAQRIIEILEHPSWLARFLKWDRRLNE